VFILNYFMQKELDDSPLQSEKFHSKVNKLKKKGLLTVCLKTSACLKNLFIMLSKSIHEESDTIC
jgi:hypothetical protein